jgi:hypothetical protein
MDKLVIIKEDNSSSNEWKIGRKELQTPFHPKMD